MLVVITTTIMERIRFHDLCLISWWLLRVKYIERGGKGIDGLWIGGLMKRRNEKYLNIYPIQLHLLLASAEEFALLCLNTILSVLNLILILVYGNMNTV